MNQKIKLPKTGKQLEKLLINAYGITEGGALAFVAIASEALDSAIKAEKLVEEHGRLIKGDRSVLRANPMLNVARDCRNRLITALGKMNMEL